MKTKIKLYTILIILIGLWGCKRTVTNGPQTQLASENTSTGEVTIYVTGSGEEDGTVTAGKNILENIASRRAFEQILYIGIPSSVNYRLPMMPNMTKDTENAFFKKFFETQDFRRFISNIRPISKTEKSSNYRNTIRYSVTINAAAFRKYLEQNQQIRKFGY